VDFLSAMKMPCCPVEQFGRFGDYECSPECVAPGSKRKQREVGVHTIVVRVAEPEFSARMAEMRKWLAQHRFDPSQFTSKPYENIVSVYVRFENDHEAETFKARFRTQGGWPESDSLPLLLNEWQWPLRFHDDISANEETIEQACWWRLKAEEVRTQAEALSSAEARETMKTVAHTWDQMAETWNDG
jgi:hypothetical protein